MKKTFLFIAVLMCTTINAQTAFKGVAINQAYATAVEQMKQKLTYVGPFLPKHMVSEQFQCEFMGKTCDVWVTKNTDNDNVLRIEIAIPVPTLSDRKEVLKELEAACERKYHKGKIVTTYDEHERLLIPFLADDGVKINVVSDWYGGSKDNAIVLMYETPKAKAVNLNDI